MYPGKPAFIAIVNLFKPRIESEHGILVAAPRQNQLSFFVWRSSHNGGAVFTSLISTILGKEARRTYVRVRTGWQGQTCPRSSGRDQNVPRRSTTSDDLDLYTHFVWRVPAWRTHGAPQHAVNSCGTFQFPLVTPDMIVWISSRMHYCEPLIEGRRLALLTGPCTGHGMPSGHAMCVSSRHTPYKMYGQVSKHGLPKSGNHPLARHLHLRRMR